MFEGVSEEKEMFVSWYPTLD